MVEVDEVEVDDYLKYAQEGALGDFFDGDLLGSPESQDDSDNILGLASS